MKEKYIIILSQKFQKTRWSRSTDIHNMPLKANLEKLRYFSISLWWTKYLFLVEIFSKRYFSQCFINWALDFELNQFVFLHSQLNTTQMWDYYLTTMFDINVDLATLAPLKRNLLNRALHAANNSGNMSEEFYLKFVELLYAHGNGKQNNTITTVSWMIYVRAW